MSIRNWLSETDSRDTYDPMDNGDKICACAVLVCIFGCFVFTFLSIWFEWDL